MSSTVGSPNISFICISKTSLPLEEIGELDELIEFDMANPDTFRKLKKGKNLQLHRPRPTKRKRFDSSEYFIDQEMSSAMGSPQIVGLDSPSLVSEQAHDSRTPSKKVITSLETLPSFQF